MKDSKCKICRRLGVKLFLKGERCLSQKCPMIRRPYPPGKKGKRRVSPLSEYGKELQEKQKLKNWYNLREAQFRKYVKEVLSSRGKAEKDPSDLLIKILESRLDSVIFRLGLASSRSQARQLVSHRHFLVNGRVVNIPSYQVKKGDIIKIKPESLKKNIFQNISARLKKQKIPSWLSFDFKNLEAKMVGEPSLEEVAPPVEIPVIFEYYSR
jgi:small subunit ribosomal protein S4